MIIRTEKNERINLTEQPRWNDFHKRFYAAGFRWIKTKQTWSKSALLHNFEKYEEEAA